MNITMLGAIDEHVRLITAQFDEYRQLIIVKYFLDRELTDDDDDDEDVDIMMHEVYAGCGYDYEFECIYSQHSAVELNHMEGAVFRRKEITK